MKRVALLTAAVPFVADCKSFAADEQADVLSLIKKNARPVGAEGMGAIDAPPNVSWKTILKNPNVKTSLTLWHLLSRVPARERELVFNKLVSVVKLPEGVSKEGILSLDKEMLNVWRMTIEGKWFEIFYGDKLTNS